MGEPACAGGAGTGEQSLGSASTPLPKGGRHVLDASTRRSRGQTEYRTLVPFLGTPFGLGTKGEEVG